MEANTLKEELVKLSNNDLYEITETINGAYPGNNEKLINLIKRSLPFYRDNDITVAAIYCIAPALALELANRLKDLYRKNREDREPFD